MSVKIIQGDCREVLRTLEADSVDLVVTSPPYWGLRDYGVVGQLGMESSLGEHIATMVDVFSEVRRVMKPTATLWLNYGDCYATAPNGRSAAATKAAGNDDRTFRDKPFSTVGNGLKAKDLCMIPNRLAIALQDDGWWVRSEIIWGKTNPMPDSSGAYRPASAHEKIFMLAKSDDGDVWRARDTGEMSFAPDLSERCPLITDKTRDGARWLKMGAYYDAASVTQGRTSDEDAVTFRGGSYVGGVPGKRTETGNKRVKMPDGWDTGEGGHGSRHRRGREQCKMIEVTPRHQGHINHTGLDELGRGDGRLLRNYEPAPLTVWPMATEPFPDAHFACVDAETEMLTPSGWKTHAQAADGEEIAMYDPCLESLSWGHATIHRYPFNGKLVAIEKRDSSQRLTPNHRCLVKRLAGKPVVVRADELKPGMKIPMTAVLNVAEKSGPGTLYASLLGWHLTEGEKKRGNIICISQSESANPRNVERIRSLLHLLSAQFKERRRERVWRGRPSIEITFAISGHIAQWLHDVSPHKKISWEWLSWPQEQIQAFVDAVIDGDGHTRRDGRCCIIQKDRDFLGALQALCLRLGYRAHIGKHADCWALFLTRGKWLTLRSTNGRHTPVGREVYRGTVWCPNVETGFWLARRKGRPFITGNTFPTELAERCIKAGSAKGALVLDPFGGSGTVGMVADRMGRDAILIELSPEYATMAKLRIKGDSPLFADVSHLPNTRT